MQIENYFPVSVQLIQVKYQINNAEFDNVDYFNSNYYTNCKLKHLCLIDIRSCAKLV